MVEFLLSIGCIGIALFGFWIMHAIDRFMDSKARRPFWDAEEERSLPPSKRAV